MSGVRPPAPTGRTAGHALPPARSQSLTSPSARRARSGRSNHLAPVVRAAGRARRVRQLRARGSSGRSSAAVPSPSTARGGTWCCCATSSAWVLPLQCSLRPGTDPSSVAAGRPVRSHCRRELLAVWLLCPKVLQRRPDRAALLVPVTGLRVGEPDAALGAQPRAVRPRTAATAAVRAPPRPAALARGRAGPRPDGSCPSSGRQPPALVVARTAPGTGPSSPR